MGAPPTLRLVPGRVPGGNCAILVLVAMLAGACTIDDVTLIEPGDGGDVEAQAGAGGGTSGQGGSGGTAGEGGAAGTGGAAGGVGGAGGTAGDGGSAGSGTGGMGGTSGEGGAGGAGGTNAGGSGGGTGGTGTGGTGPVGPPVLHGTFVGASIAGTASGIRIRGNIAWHASIRGSGANGVTLDGWLR